MLFVCHSECGDWYGIYINGELNYEGHDIPNHVWMTIIQMNRYYLSVEEFEVSDEYMERGSFPDKFEDIPKEFYNRLN